MSTIENQAAQTDPLDAFVQGPIDQGSEQVVTDSQLTESAPTLDADKPELTEAERPASDGFQKRIDKVTTDKYEHKRRADALQIEIDQLKAANRPPATQRPKLDDPEIDYDDEAFAQANHAYDVNMGVEAELSKRSQQAAAQSKQAADDKAIATFNDRITALGKSDFDKMSESIPQLPNGVANAMMEHEQGAEMIYHLGQNPVLADAIASMSPSMAMMELGKLSSSLSTKPEIKTSAAPEPIETLGSGRSSVSQTDEEMSMADFMAKYG